MRAFYSPRCLGGREPCSVVHKRQKSDFKVHRYVSTNVATASPPVEEARQPLKVHPNDLQIASGQLSEVKRTPSTSELDVFRCNGCTETACMGPTGCSQTAWRFDESGYLRAILTARVYDVAVESPLELAVGISESSGNAIYLKREDLQPVFSFKLRGAFNKMVSLTKEQLAAGVICSSAGNHAQGVALAAQRLGTSAVICMPVSTPEIKVDAVRALGAEVRLVGESYTETQAYACQASEAEDRSFIAPYDDPLTIAGQGTIGMEVLKQLGSQVDDLKVIFVAIGGGGLIAGIAAYVKLLKPDVKIIGVEPTGANCMAQSLVHGERVVLSAVNAFADGVAVKSVGAETFRLCQQHCDGVILVDNAQISAAIKDVFTETRTILEPAGAVAVAGAKAYFKHYEIKDSTCVAVTSGANMNFDRLSLVADLANFGLRTETMLTVSLPEVPGSFLRFVDVVTMQGDGGNFTELKYRYSADRDAQILVSLTSKDMTTVHEAVKRATDAGFVCKDVSKSTTAQVHLRHLVGGRPRAFTGQIADEKMAVVTFPERKGALKHYLNSFSQFNITMFHYRGSGNRASSALVGMQVPPSGQADYEAAAAALTPKDFAFQDLSAADREMFDQFIS